MFKVNNKDTGTMASFGDGERWRQWRRSDVFIVNFEHISYLALMFLLLNLSKVMLAKYKGILLSWGTERLQVSITGAHSYTWADL